MAKQKAVNPSGKKKPAAKKPAAKKPETRKATGKESAPAPERHTGAVRKNSARAVGLMLRKPAG